MSDWYKLPDGTIIKDAEKYIDAWRKNGEIIERVTGWELYAYDPGYSFHNGHHPISLSWDEVSAIVAIIGRAESAEASVRELEARLGKTCGCGWTGDTEYRECADHAALRLERDELKAEVDILKKARNELNRKLGLAYCDILETVAGKRGEMPALSTAEIDALSADKE